MTAQRNFIDLDDLKAAGRRTDDYEARYGLEVAWVLGVTGMRLCAAHGADTIVKYVSWDEIATDRIGPFDILEKTEKAALAGLSR